MKKQVIGFIGQGFIGKHMADDFENRGYETVRYALEAPYAANKDAIADCPIVFIAVPTPTSNRVFDSSALQTVLSLVGKGSIAVIKSTILPGTTQKLQAQFPDIHVMHSPEFLREKSAAEDTAKPERNIVGVPDDSPEAHQRAQSVLDTLPTAPYNLITTARNAECVKYIGNTFLYTKLVFMNIAHDFAQAAEADWKVVSEAVGKDSRIGTSHMQPVSDNGRGAGGHCFIKDFEAYAGFYDEFAHDMAGSAVLDSLRNKNNQLLLDSQKDLDLLKGVYGSDIPVAPGADERT